LDDPDYRNFVCWKGNNVHNNRCYDVLWYVDNDNSGSPTVGDEFVDADVVFNALLKWGIDPDNEGPIKIKAYDV